MSSIAFLALFFSMFVAASALDCYTCNDCSGLSYVTTSQTCSAPLINIHLNEPRCMKEVTFDGVVKRYCSTVGGCGTLEAVLKCSPGSEVGCYTCCNSDNCNSASIATVSMVTMLVLGCVALLGVF